MYANSQARMNGADVTQSASTPVLQPLIDKVGVPLLWFGIGYLACTFFGKKHA